MGRWLGVCTLTITLCLTLTCCGGEGGSQAEQLALDIRAEYLEMAGCTASMEVTADYGQRVYDFGVELTWQREGESVLTITAPENVAGVTARLEQDQAYLEYDGVRVETGPLDGTGLSPVSSVPVLLDYAQTGYIAACGLETRGEREVLRVGCRDPEAQPGTGRECALWFDPDTHDLLRGELSQDGYTVIQCAFSDFQLIPGAED